jgi:hypothetical protein
MEARICPHCGAKNEEKTWICTNCGENLYGHSTADLRGTPSTQDESWRCKNCKNNNVSTLTRCSVCGQERNSLPPKLEARSFAPTPPPIEPVRSSSIPSAEMIRPSSSKSLLGLVVLGSLGLFALCILALGGLWYYRGSSNRAIPTKERTSLTHEDTPVPSNSPTDAPVLSVDNIQVTEAPSLELVPTPITDPDFDWTKCHAKYSTRIRGGDEVVLNTASSTSGYHLFSTPYLDSKKVGSVSPGDQARVLGGPSCSNGWIWWYIQMNEDETKGWFPEGTKNEYWLSPLETGTETYATISNEIYKASLRKTPGFQGKMDSEDVIVEISQGERVIVISGPTNEDGLNWWRVEWNGYTGWMAEKTASGKQILIFP